MSLSERQLADLCQEANRDWSNVVEKPGAGPDGWTVAQQINGAPTDSAKNDGFSAVILQKDGETVVVFKGTDFGTYGDVAADIDLGVSADNPQYVALERFLADHKGDLTGNVTFAGHSLGGNLAMHATMASGVEASCVTFNAPGFSDEYMKAHPEFDSMGNRITEYQNERDFVSSIGHHPGSVVIAQTVAGALEFNHDLVDFAWDGDSLVRTDPAMKAGRCYMVEQVVALADKLVPDGGITHTLVKGVLEIVYSNPKAAADFIRQVAIQFPAAVGAVVVAALAIVVVVAAFELGMWIGTTLMDFTQLLAGEAIKIVKAVIKTVVDTGVMLVDAAAKLYAGITGTIKDLCAKLGDKLAAFWEKLFGGAAAALGALSVNLDELSQLAQRLRRVQNRVSSIDRRLGRLAWVIEPEKKLAVASIDWTVDRGRVVAACASYLEATASRLDSAERAIARSAASMRA